MLTSLCTQPPASPQGGRPVPSQMPLAATQTFLAADDTEAARWLERALQELLLDRCKQANLDCPGAGESPAQRWLKTMRPSWYSLKQRGHRVEHLKAEVL